MHPDELLAELSSAQFAEWLAYYQTEPRGEDRDDWRTAAMVAALVNQDPWRSNQARKLRAEDVVDVIRDYKVKQAPTAEEMEQAFLEAYPEK